MAGYTASATSPQTPHLITIEGTSYPYFNHISNPHTPTVNLALATPRWPSGGLSLPEPYESNPGSWLTINVGSDSTPLEVYFADNTPTPIPLHLRRLNAISSSETWAQGIVVLMNVHFHAFVRDVVVAPNSRLYAGFCIQVFVGDTLATGKWYIIQRTIRFVSEKILPSYPYFETPYNDGGFVVPGAENPYISDNAKVESWIDVPIRTVIRKQDLIDFGFPDEDGMPPVLGVRACVGKWEVYPGPVQPGSYTRVPPEDIPPGEPTVDTNTKVYIRQGNMTIFPLHAAAGFEQFVK